MSPASRNVADTEATYREANPDKNVKYFPWTDDDELKAWIDEQNKATGRQVAVIGHSFGGDTAASVVAGGTGVSLLVAVDPVGHSFDPAVQGLPPKPTFDAITNNASTWININVVGDNNSSGTRSNFIAGAGQSWNDKPSGKATCHYDVPINHNNFAAVIPLEK